MTGTSIISTARISLGDIRIPYLWSNAELATALTEATVEACRRSYCYVTYPSQVIITGESDISFAASTKTISKATGGFLSAGGLSEVNTFEIDDEITIASTLSNNGVKTISRVTDTAITVKETLVNESNVSAILEATRTVTRIPLRTDVHTYKLHPQTLMVIRARPDSLTYPLRQKTIWSLDSDIRVVDYDLGDYGTGAMYYDSWETLEGNTYAFLEENGFIRLISPPQSDDILWLVVARLPKIVFTDSNLDLTPEIPAQYQYDLVDWILYKAYSKPDSDTQDLVKAKLWLDSFERKFGLRPSAQTEQNRKRYPPNMRMRPRQFGFSG